MPGRAREDAAGTIHHVTTRGNDRIALVRDDTDRIAFLRLFAQYVSEQAAPLPRTAGSG